jgi:hypothetical protein
MKSVVEAKHLRLPRSTRRWLRAVEHRASLEWQPALTPEQLAGWRSLQRMSAEQSKVEG